MAKPLICQFKAKTAHLPDGADSASAAEEGQHEEQTPPPPFLRCGGLRELCAADATPIAKGQRTEEQKDLWVLVLIKTCLCLH